MMLDIVDMLFFPKASIFHPDATSHRS